MKTRIKWMIAILVLLIAGCKTTNEIYNHQNIKIEFGNSGGFTNASMNYHIDNNGNLFKQIEQKFVYIKTIDRKQLKEFNKMLKVTNYQQMNLNEPGNLTYYIKVKSPKYSNIVQWNDQSKAKEADQIYNQLISIVKK